MYSITLVDNHCAALPNERLKFFAQSYDDAFKAASKLETDPQFPSAAAYVRRANGTTAIIVPKFYFPPDDEANA